MNAMIERVARAIAGCHLVGSMVDAEWRDYEDEARAAIAAMRNPTEEMVMACINHREDGEWEAMIDAALAE